MGYPVPGRAPTVWSMTDDIIGPSSHFYVSQRLRLHYVDWGNDEAPTLLLLHGGRDHARSWDWVARELRHDWHVVAPDLRGHGDSGHALGGSYTKPDFVLDVAQLAGALGGEKVTIVAHSLGGAVALHYAGVFPERVAKLVAIEGLGPPPKVLARMRDVPVWERVAGWVDSTRKLAARTPRRYASIGEAAARMQAENAFLSSEQARHLTVHGVARNEDGTFSWKFDNYVRAFGPYRFTADETRALWERVECPVLLVRGAESWASDPEQDGRMESFRAARAVTIENAEHWVHHDQLDEFLRTVREFLAE
jgi:pimeloyl-ACP methyl ester carboxylesterase